MTPPIWRKSSRSSDGTSGQCVEVARLLGTIGVRDSKKPGDGHLTLEPERFARIIRQAKNGQLDR